MFGGHPQYIGLRSFLDHFEEFCIFLLESFKVPQFFIEVLHVTLKTDLSLSELLQNFTLSHLLIVLPFLEVYSSQLLIDVLCLVIGHVIRIYHELAILWLEITRVPSRNSLLGLLITN